MMSSPVDDAIAAIGDGYLTAMRDDLFIRVAEERRRQVVKWGERRNNDPFEWVSVLTEEVGEVAQAVNDGELESAFHELVQVAAVALAFLEDLEVRDAA